MVKKLAEDAKHLLDLVIIKQKNAEAAARRQQKAFETAEKEKALGTY